MSHVIYFIVCGCYLGPKASSKLDHLKLRDSKASQQFIQCIFLFHPDRVKYEGCVSLVIYFIVSGYCQSPKA